MRPLNEIATVADIIAGVCAVLTLIGFVAAWLWRRSRAAPAWWVAAGTVVLVVCAGGWVLAHWLTGEEQQPPPSRYTAQVSALPVPLPRLLTVTGTLTPTPDGEVLWATARDAARHRIGEPAPCTVTGGQFRCDPIDLGEDPGEKSVRAVELVVTGGDPSAEDLDRASTAGRVDIGPEETA